MATKVLSLLLLFCVANGSRIPRKDSQSDTWFRHTNVYQIYPRSFKDSDNDGVGDIRGIESKLDYFVDLNIETIWLSPIFKSPMADFGYDISNYTDIDPIFGTMDDFKSLLQTAHGKGLKIVLDFVPNHSSNEHDWFQRSIKKEDPYTDYYVWVDPKGYDENGQPIPPSNWVSFFRYSMWEFNQEREQFYLHQFLKEQPDLNYKNPAVVKEMQDVLKFWLDLGVDGFRFDAVATIWEDDRYLDEPESGNPAAIDENDWLYYDHIYTYNLPETRDVLGKLHQTIKEQAEIDGYPRVTMLEVYLEVEEEMKYYECSDFPFNFAMISDDPLNATIVKTIIDDWMKYMPEGKTANWVLGNHDRSRLGSRVGSDMADALNLLSLTLPGVAVTYYGEELGMTNTNISYEDTVDPSGCNCGPDHYQECSRDPARTPMQWSADENNAGFTNADKPWLPINPNYPEINVATEKMNQFSHWSIYKLINDYRNSELILSDGLLRTFVVSNVLAFSRSINEVFPTFVTVVNFNNEPITVDLYGQFHTALDMGLIMASTKIQETNHAPGEFVDVRSIHLAPHEGLLFWLVSL